MKQNSCLGARCSRRCGAEASRSAVLPGRGDSTQRDLRYPSVKSTKSTASVLSLKSTKSTASVLSLKSIGWCLVHDTRSDQLFPA